MLYKILPTLLAFFILSFGVQAQTEYHIFENESTIHFQSFGSGIPILIINGGPGMSSEGFIPLAQRIGEKNQSIIYDQRGTGTSTLERHTSGTITMDLMVSDIEAIREHLNIDKWIILGHSFGGIMASYYASKHPDKTLGLILSSSGGLDLKLLSIIDIRGRLSSTQNDSLSYWENRIRKGDNSSRAKLNRGKFLASAYLYDESLVPIIAKRLTQGNMTINSLVFRDLRRINYDTKEILSKYPKPVLIIQGAYDIIPLQISEVAHKVFPNSELVVLPESGHYGWLEDEELYFQSIERFLKKTSNS